MQLLQQIWHLARSSLYLWSERNAPRLGAAVAFYSIFSLTPLVMIAVLVAGVFVGTDFARKEFLDELSALMGDQAAAAIESMMSASLKSGRGTLAGITSAVTLLIGATGVLVELRTSLDEIHQAKTPDSLSGMVHGRLWSLALVLAVGFLLLVSLLLSAVIAALAGWLAATFPVLGVVARLFDILFPLAVLTALFGLLMRWLPSERQPWRSVWGGALLAAVLLSIGKHLLGLYLGRAAFSDPFGAAGSLVVLVMWVYYAVQVFLLGAAFNEVRRAERAGRPPDARKKKRP